MSGRRVRLQTLGCRLNEAELEGWARQFRAHGMELTDSPERADLVVVNTCAVTAEAVRKSRQLLRKARRANPRSKLAVSGCYASLDDTDAAELCAELGIDLLVPNRDKDRLVEIAVEELRLPTMPQAATDPQDSALLARGRHRAFIKVQDGCRYRCTYCVVTLARGAERSRPIEEVVAEIRRHRDAGVKEVVLTGVHLGGYGSDRGIALSDLIRAVLDDTDLPRLRLGSLEPWDLPPGFWSLFDNPRLMPHLHLPIQSGSDPVLRRMARRCRTDEFRRLVEDARSRVADFNVTTDVIAGFPGETETEWRQTLDFVETIRFGHVHVFAFSPRRGTKAADLPSPVDPDTRRLRSRQLHRLAADHRRETLERHLDRPLSMLVEGEQGVAVDGRRRWVGYSANYLKLEVLAAADAGLDNRILEVESRSLSDDGERLICVLR